VNNELYTHHFGFRERPFTLLPDPDFLFWSKAHRRAFAVLEYGLTTRAPLTVVTGEVGAGKTTLIQALLKRVGGDVTVGLISNAQGDRGALLRWVLNALDVRADPRSDYVALFQQFQDFVISEYADGRHVVLIIDEAQNLGPDSLEELRMLTNINSNKDELLQIILLGQPELYDVIRQPGMRQFAQRVTATYHLEPMDLATTRDYIRHRLVHAGGTGDEIAQAAVQHIHSESGGIPRMVNKLCDLALVYAASADRDQVDVETLNELIADGLVLKPRQPPLFLTNRVDLRGEAAE
jgi:general secretion pathway protein A